MLLVRIIRLSHLIKQVQFFHSAAAVALMDYYQQIISRKYYAFTHAMSVAIHTFGSAKKLQDIGWPSL